MVEQDNTMQGFPGTGKTAAICSLQLTLQINLQRSNAVSIGAEYSSFSFSYLGPAHPPCWCKKSEEFILKIPHSNHKLEDTTWRNVAVPRAPWTCSSPRSARDPGPGGSQQMQEFRAQTRWGCSTPHSRVRQQSDSSCNHGTWVILNRTQGRMPKNFCFSPNPVQPLWITSYYISPSAHSVCPHKSRNWSTLWL